ncbi:sodium:alanine symporter [Clostridia bacterium]|nr:sodium:alanine symporter [Clostridia bacterium]
MSFFLSWIDSIHRIVWGPWSLLLFIGVGLFYSIRLHFFQILHFPVWIKATIGSLFDFKLSKKNRSPASKESEEKGISKFQSLCTSLAATLGTGNISGVATALAAGGPGAIFWMWVSATLGMMTIYAENYLGILYRFRNQKGEWSGGAMTYMERGLGWKKTASLFAFFCILVSFGMGNMAQANSISMALKDIQRCSPWISGIVLCVLVALVILGGAKRIAKVSEQIIPLSSIVYVGFSLLVLFFHASAILPSLKWILVEAFSFRAVTGGVVGYSVLQAIQYGVSRGVFSNEAGLGSSVMIHIGATDTTPKIQGMWGILELWLDTIVMCTITALVLLCSGVYGNSQFNGASLVLQAFQGTFHSVGTVLLLCSMFIFAFATLIGWAYMGGKSVEYLFGEKGLLPYHLLFLFFIVLGSVMELDLVWKLADIFNGLMAIPNLIALILLHKQVKV